MPDTLPPRLGWNDLPPGAPSLFDIWLGEADKKWAKSAWGILAEQGLTDFRTENERTRVQIRLLALATFYHSYCYAAYQEGGAQPDDWASWLELNPFRIAQLAGVDFRENTIIGPEELLEEAVFELVEQEYPIVAKAIAEAFDDVGLLFAFLWLSSNPELSGNRSPSQDVLNDVLNEDGFEEKSPGLDWVVTGFPISYA